MPASAASVRFALAFGVLLTAPAARTATVLGACGTPATRVHAIQGTARSSPFAGEEHAVEATVVGVFPGLGGFFLQEADADVDTDPATSEGLFVFDGGLGAGLRAGDRARVLGRVSEFFGLTELSSVRDVQPCPPRGEASAASIRLPLADEMEWEQWEGMRVRVGPALVATGLSNLARFGEVELAAGERLWQPTHRAAPGAPALALRVDNERRRILLDDGSDRAGPVPTPYLERADGGTLRAGDRLPELEGVLDFAFGRFRVHPIESVRFVQGEPRPAMPPRVDGTLRVVTWNVENHFNGDGVGGGFPTRGPRSPAELERQRAKLVSTLVRLDPDVAALVELENDGTGPESAVGQLVRALNDQTLGAPYAAVGASDLGSHPISVGILYRPSAVTPLGPSAVLDGAEHPAFDDTAHRPSLAQTFEARATRERLTVVVNHWKSKGSDCAAGGDPDLGDGQGDCNGTRSEAARALVEWLARDPTASGGAPVLVAGDLNAYPREDPVRIVESAGYVDLLARFAGPGAHTYVFEGEAGRLDHLLGRVDLEPLAPGAGVWHTNADEPPIFGYGAEGGRYPPDPFRASDHDPILLGLFPDADGDGRTDVRDACPHSTRAETVRLGACDSGVREHLDASGCTLRDRLASLVEPPLRPHWKRELRAWLGARSDEGTITRADHRPLRACVARLRRARQRR